MNDLLSKISFSRLLVLLIIGVPLGCAPLTAGQTQTPAPLLPGGSQVFIPTIQSHLPLPPADEATTRLSLPAGFAIRIFAQNITGKLRFMAFGPDGQLYASLLSAGQIIRLPDRNLDGLSDGTEIVASGLNQPHGVEWKNGWLYVAENDRVERLSASPGSSVLDLRELITTNLPGGGGHNTRTLHFGPDGMLYVSAGSSCNVCTETDPRRAAILRFNPDGTIPADNPFVADTDPLRRPVWAFGLRNSVDFTWTPGGQLWADHNGRDQLGDNLPPEEAVIAVQKGKSHGWPYCYTAVLGANSPLQAEVLDVNSGQTPPAGFDCSLANVQPALFTIPAHSAPLGMAFANKSLFPAIYQQDLFMALHGSWNISSTGNIRDCKVERVVVENGLPVRSETFISGWRPADKPCGDPLAWGRPVDVVFGPDGSMFISDDSGGRVYRVVYTG